ncbi:hypothetical protein N480_06285 [Pseudoalteromonas luteoviolacea S2607]|uniref:non-ribosomal peptide synthetase n=1 Tax=Pseudoalteromonas luteoviolacea TaxID=43657 RepID=UPI0007B08B88|nr:non-ribosomal peptide synthetase [Pseudoalteromonas luteoviolacea]KZN30564.1 hypothetical protein N480_06285 [Pseudoalteromonas luteoviolacea S2607]
MNKVEKILDEAVSNQVHLYLKENRLAYKAKKGSLSDKLKKNISENKQEIIEYLKNQTIENEISTAAVTRISKRPTSDSAPLSFAQQRLWVLDQLQGGSPEYNMPLALKVAGKFDLAAAETAMLHIINRHEVLKTVFSTHDGSPIQLVKQHVDFRLQQYDLSELDKHEQDTHIASFVQQEIAKPFELSKDIMVRATYLLLSPQKDEGMLLFNMHHIASDGWSMGLMFKEFAAEYDALVSGKISAPIELPIQYADYAYWQRTWLQGEVLDKQLNYWQKQLENVPVIHSLPLDKPRPKVKQHKGKAVSLNIDKATSARLLEVANAHQLTPFMLIHASLALVISRHSNSQDIVIGTPIANRMQAELETLIGFFVNTLVLRTNTNHKTLEGYLAHIRQVNIDAQANQDTPFEHLVEHCNIPRSSQHNPLFQIMFSMNTNEPASVSLPGIRFSAYEHSNINCKFDLDIKANITEAGISFQWVYDESLFSHDHIETLSKHLAQLLEGFAESHVTDLEELPMLSKHEVFQLTSTLNSNQISYPNKLLHELFEDQAANTPDNIALVFDGATMTYNTLNERANQLAQYLREQGITTETLIGICVERSFDMIVGILAVLKAGGAYVPLDPHYPRARLQHILADTQIKYLLSNTSVIEQVSLPDALNVVLIDKQQFDNYSTSNLIASTEHHSHSLAYIIYTSGSTGVPKGVMVEHHGVVNTILSQIDTFAISPQSKVLQFASMCFDASVSEIFMAILSGAQLHLCHAKAVSDTTQLEAMIQHQGITHITLPPSLLNNMTLDNSAIQTLIVAGDKASESLIDKFSERFTLINAYGPTEASICVTAGRLSPNAHINIGRPISNVDVYILSPSRQLAPKGSVGELYVGGAGIARGYLNRESQTAERFIKNPFNDNPENKLYRTGDLVRYLDDGNIEFIGRNDTQVKIRGYRIELGEVESALNQCNGVKNSVVLVKGSEENKSLVGYVAVEGDIVGNESTLIHNLRAELHTMLPNYMVPSMFMLLDQLPLTTNGKIDKKALPDPDASLGQQNYVAPQSETEESLLQIWSKLLKVDSSKLSVTVNFYEIGGHSLLTIKLLAAIREQFDLEIAVNQIFEFETISKLAGLIDDLQLRKMLSDLKESAEFKSEGTL